MPANCWERLVLRGIDAVVVEQSWGYNLGRGAKRKEENSRHNSYSCPCNSDDYPQQTSQHPVFQVTDIGLSSHGFELGFYTDQTLINIVQLFFNFLEALPIRRRWLCTSHLTKTGDSPRV